MDFLYLTFSRFSEAGSFFSRGRSRNHIQISIKMIWTHITTINYTLLTPQLCICPCRVGRWSRRATCSPRTRCCRCWQLHFVQCTLRPKFWGGVKNCPRKNMANRCQSLTYHDQNYPDCRSRLRITDWDKFGKRSTEIYHILTATIFHSTID